MPTLYLTEQGSSLHCSGGRLRLERGERVLWCGPLAQVDSVMVLGNVQLTTAALGALMHRRAEVAFLSARGKLKGRVTPALGHHLALRLHHYARHGDAAFGLEIGRAIVEGKIRNSRTVVMRWARNARDAGLRTSLEATAAALLRFQKQPARAGSLQRLLGIEGNAARLHFEAMRQVAGVPEFAGRTRPATDPLNALLNLGYTLAGCEIAAALGAVGLDASLGLYHVSRSKNTALAFDLLEEFRAPFIDRLAVTQWKLQVVQAHSFQATGTGLRLKPNALKKFLRAYDAALNAPFKEVRTGKAVTFRKLFLLQARCLADAVRNNRPDYVPYRHR